MFNIMRVGYRYKKNLMACLQGWLSTPLAWFHDSGIKIIHGFKRLCIFITQLKSIETLRGMDGFSIGLSYRHLWPQDNLFPNPQPSVLPAPQEGSSKRLQEPVKYIQN